MLADVDAALDHLRAQGFADEHIGIVGFCFGGRVTFMVSLHRALGAAVGFYGGGIVTARFPQFPPLVERSASLQTPWLGLFGDEDASIPVEDVEQIRSALRAAPVDTEVVRYADAKHGFHCDVRADYHADAAADAWRPHARLVRQVPLGAGTPFSHPFHPFPASRRCRDRARCPRAVSAASALSSRSSSSWSWSVVVVVAT